MKDRRDQYPNDLDQYSYRAQQDGGAVAMAV
jgi:hypothetical protein